MGDIQLRVVDNNGTSQLIAEDTSTTPATEILRMDTANLSVSTDITDTDSNTTIYDTSLGKVPQSTVEQRDVATVAQNYQVGPPHTQSNGITFMGATVAPSGRVILAPRGSDNVGIVDTGGGEVTYSSGPAHGRSGEAFEGCTVAPNGKVILAPNDSDKVGVVETPPAPDSEIKNKKNGVSYKDGPSHGEGDDAFNGATVAPNGKVILAPQGSSNVGIVEVDGGNFSYTSGPDHGEGENAFFGATVAPNGKVILPAKNSDNIGVVDPTADPVTYRGIPHNEGSGNTFSDAAVAPTGEVIFAPEGASNIGILETNGESFTYRSGPQHDEQIDFGAFSAASVAPSGQVILAPFASNNVGIVDTSGGTVTYTSGPAHSGKTTAYQSATVAPTGQVIMAPVDTDVEIGIVSGPPGLSLSKRLSF